MKRQNRVLGPERETAGVEGKISSLKENMF